MQDRGKSQQGRMFAHLSLVLKKELNLGQVMQGTDMLTRGRERLPCERKIKA